MVLPKIGSCATVIPEVCYQNRSSFQSGNQPAANDTETLRAKQVGTLHQQIAERSSPPRQHGCWDVLQSLDAMLKIVEGESGPEHEQFTPAANYK